MLNTLFSSMGFTVLAVENGVYLLARNGTTAAERGKLVGLLFSDQFLGPSVKNVKFFHQELSESTPADRIMQHWQTMDARRLEESGLPVTVVDLPPELIPAHPGAEQVLRPDGLRYRQYVRLISGELVCYS